MWAKATAQDTPAASAGAEAESPRAAPGASTTGEVAKAVAAKAPFQDEKVKEGMLKSIVYIQTHLRV